MSASEANVVVGAPDDDDGATRSGAAYLMSPAGREERLTAPDPGEDDRFGVSVAAGGEWVAVGAPGEDSRGETDAHDDDSPDSGAVFLYFRPTNP